MKNPNKKLVASSAGVILKFNVSENDDAREPLETPSDQCRSAIASIYTNRSVQ